LYVGIDNLPLCDLSCTVLFLKGIRLGVVLYMYMYLHAE